MTKRILFCLLALLFCLGGCQKTKAHSVTYYELFDTVITFTAYTDNVATFDGWALTLKEKLTAIHQAADPYHAYPSAPHNLFAVQLNPYQKFNLSFLAEIDKLVITLIWKFKTPRIAKNSEKEA